LTGLFIDQGPVVQVRNGQGRIEIEADTDAGTVWDGPLVVVVSRASASATEIFAGAIQDYGRGLIVGETTFGKGTVQNLVDLDQMANSTENRFGQLKMTIAQYFRVSGSSTQHRGVVPDIRFPQTLSPDEYGESSYDNALPYASIRPATYVKLGRPGDLVPILAARFEQRSQKDREFQLLSEELAEMEALRTTKTVSLLYSERKTERDRQEARRKEREQLRAALTGKQPDPASEQLDDGLDAGERLPDPDEDELRDPDVLLRHASRIAADLSAFSDPQMATAMREAHQGSKPAATLR
jgi:carboxyl-terminal processing protease